MNFNTARFFLSRLESLSAAPTSLSFLRFRSKSSKSSEGAGRDCVFRVSLLPVVSSLLLTEDRHSSHRLAIPRINVGMFYCLVTVSASGGKTLISRINLIRPPPAAPYGLAPCGICGQFPHLLTQTRKPSPNTTGQE